MNEFSVIVLGGSGLVGGQIVSLLQHDYSVIAVQRSKHGKNPKVSYRQADARDLRGMSELMNQIQGRKLIIDAVLDKHDAKSLSGGIVSASQTIANVLAGRSDVVGVVCISSTAIFAPWPLRSSYANAKIRQCEIYIERLDNVSLFVCPQVVQATSQKTGASSNPNDKIAIDSKQAAQCVRAIVNEYRSVIVNGHVMYLPSQQHYKLITANTSVSRRASCVNLLRGCTSWLVRPSTRHHSERLITHALLNLLPSEWRKRADHHVLPEKIVLKTAQRYKFALRIIQN